MASAGARGRPIGPLVHRRRESSVEEALIEMYLAASRFAGSRTSPRRYGARECRPRRCRMRNRPNQVVAMIECKLCTMPVDATHWSIR
jgi:hypothetical protein